MKAHLSIYFAGFKKVIQIAKFPRSMEGLSSMKTHHLAGVWKDGVNCENNPIKQKRLEKTNCFLIDNVHVQFGVCQARKGKNVLLQ